MARKPKIILGVHTAIIGERLDFSANTPNILSINTNEKANPIPSAKLSPIPPLLFMAETATAIIVSINAETGRLYFL